MEVKHTYISTLGEVPAIPALLTAMRSGPSPASARDHRLDVLRVAYVRGVGQSAASMARDGSGHALGAFVVQIHHEHGGAAKGECPRACLADSCLRPRDDRRTSVELVSRHPNPSVANGLQSTLPPARPRATRFDACCAPRSAASLAARRPSIVTGVRLGPLAPVQDVTRVHGSNPTGDL